MHACITDVIALRCVLSGPRRAAAKAPPARNDAMNRSAEAHLAAAGLLIAFPLRMPAGGIVSTSDADQLQQPAHPALLGQKAS